MYISGDITLEMTKNTPIHWADARAFSKNHGIACPCIICEECPAWLQADRVSLDSDGELSAHFNLQPKIELKKINLKIVV